MIPATLLLPTFFIGAAGGWVCGLLRGAKVTKAIYNEGLNDLLREVRGRSPS